MESTVSNKPLVSVVMATYNGEKFIAEQIASILVQNDISLELIICDDGSTDGTIGIIETFMKENPRILLYQNNERLGFVRNFEKGIGLSRGSYIALSDQDDIWEVDKLQIQMYEILLKERVYPKSPVMIHSDLSVVDAEGKLQHSSYVKLKKYALKKGKDLGHIAGPSGVMGNTIFFNKALKEICLPFPECIAFHDQWIALVNEISGVRVTLQNTLVRYRIHQSNNSNSEKTLAHDRLDVITSFLKREITPPYLDSTRACMIEQIFDRYTLQEHDALLLKHFLAYLKSKKGSWELLCGLWHYDLLKRDLWYRLAFSANYLLFQERKEKIYLFGFSRWKRNFIKPFFILEGESVFCQTVEEARSKGMKSTSAVYIWGKRSFSDVEEYVRIHGNPIFRVEDGFIRSVSLGSDLTKAYSLIIDSRGIYFDPHEESDLEVMLNEKVFDESLIRRAQKLQIYLREKRISKYNTDQESKVILPDLKPGQKVILVPGQVEDDASIVYGADGMSNLELLQKCRKVNKESYIIFKPHPDVLAGNRRGRVDASAAKKYCNRIIQNVSLDSLFDLVDEVHTMTSLVGFEALIRGKQVHAYGLPFYAGWGLTGDVRVSPRRKIERSLDELVAAALICYPKYINPSDDLPCEIEVLLEALDKEKRRYNENSFYRAFTDGRNTLSRILQRWIKVFKDE